MGLLSKYKVVTITHHNLNVSEIGHFFLPKSDIFSQEERLEQLKQAFNLDECMYLETCNRVTFLMFADFQLDAAFLKSFFLDINPELQSSTIDSIHKFVSAYEGEGAVKHLFEMASSMDSLVVGEREIFRQFRSAYEACRTAKLTGDNLRILEKAIVATAKEIYHNTKIGEKALSVVSLAINALFKNQVTADAKVLLVGAGETNALVAKFLKKYNFKNIKIYNRSLHNAVELSSEIGAESFHIHDLKHIEGDFDIVFICTSANKVIIDDQLYQEMLAGDTKKKTLIDLAVPRNIGQDVVDNNKVQYIDIEGLRKLSEANLEFRKQEVEKARPIITKNIQAFTELYQRRQIEKAMAAVPKEISAIKNKALTSVYKDRIEHLDEDSKALLIEMMDYMEKKCISVPMKIAKSELVPTT